MGMSTHVKGLRDPDGEKHQKMVAAAKALYEAGINEFPPELAEYFEGYYETSEIVGDSMAGCEVNIDDAMDESHDRCACNDWTVDLRKLPDGVTHIRFTNSY